MQCYRDATLPTVGEGTSAPQRQGIARRLLEKYRLELRGRGALQSAGRCMSGPLWQPTTRNALASSPLQHTLRTVMSGCSPAPVRDSRPLWAFLAYWQHRSGLLQTCAAATSHRADDV